MPTEKETNLQPFTLEQLATSEKILPERIAEINHDVEAGERRRLDVVLESATEVAHNVSEKTQERFAFMGSIGMYTLLNEMKQNNPQVGDLMLLEQRIAGGKNDFDVCVEQGKKQAVMQEFGWDKRHIELGRGIVGTGKQMVDMMERQEKPDFPWQAVTLNGETVYVQNPEEMLFSKINALVNPGLDDEGSVREREIKWGVDIKILKTYLMVEKGIDAQELDNYLAERWKVYTESERYGSVTQLAEQFDSAGDVQRLLVPVMEKMLGRPITDLRADLISSVGNGSEELVDGLLAVKDREAFVGAMRAVVDYKIGKPMTFEEAQLVASEEYGQLLNKPAESLVTRAEGVKLEGYIPSEEQLRQVNSLLEITKRCEEAGIVVVVSGGYGFDGLYGKLTRPHGDIDMLVVGSDMSGFTGILEDLGYSQDFAEADKNVYRNAKINPNFKVEFASADMLGQFTEEGVDYFIPDEPNATLNGQSFKAMTLRGQKKAVEIQNVRAKQKGWGNYPEEKRLNQNALIADLEQKGVI